VAILPHCGRSRFAAVSLPIRSPNVAHIIAATTAEVGSGLAVTRWRSRASSQVIACKGAKVGTVAIDIRPSNFLK